MASEERQSMIFFSKSSSYYGESVVEEIMSMSPNGPLSDLNYASSHSSTSGSEIGSPEIETEDEAILAELTRRMAEFTFDDDDEEEDLQSQKSAASSFSQDNNSEGGVGYNSSSSGSDFNQAIKSASKQPTADSGLSRNLNADIFSLQIYPMRNQQVRKEGAECGGRSCNKTAQQKDHHRDSKTQDKKTWTSSVQSGVTFPSLPLHGSGSGMRAVFLDGSKKSNSVSNGTGVFIPNTTFSKPYPKKKTGCSTVLIPARVLQTLQQHFNSVGAKSQSQSSQVSTNQPWQNDVLARINGLLSQQQDQVVCKIQPPEPANDPEEYRLPHEWTY